MSDPSAPVSLKTAPRSTLRRCALAAWLGAPWLLVALMAWTSRPYALDLVAHFLLHAAALLMLTAIALLVLRRPIAASSPALVALALIVGWRTFARGPTGGDVAGTITLVEFNMQGESSRHDNNAAAWLRDQNADVIVLIEPPIGLLEDYPYLKRAYPYSVAPEAGLMWEVMLLSRFPAEVRAIAEYSEETKFSFAARRSMVVTPSDGAPFLLTAMHPPSPRTPETWKRALEGVQLNGRLLREFARESGMPVIVAGDFNSTPFGRVHREFARESGLTGWCPLLGGGTWPARLPAWLSIPIDRVWTSAGMEMRSMHAGPRFRSDHRPIVARVARGPSQTPSDLRPREPASDSVR